MPAAPSHSLEESTTIGSTIISELDFLLSPRSLQSELTILLDGGSPESPRVTLLYATVFETYSAGDRIGAVGVVLTVPIRRTKGGGAPPSTPKDSTATSYRKFVAWLISPWTHSNPSLEPPAYSLLQTPSKGSSNSRSLQPIESRASRSPSAPLLSCSSCRKTFTQLSTLTHHQRCHERGFTCDLCHASFTWPKDLRRHLTTHSTARHLSCPLCQNSFSRRDNLLRHLRYNHGFVQRGRGSDKDIAEFAAYARGATPGLSDTAAYAKCSTPGSNSASTYSSNFNANTPNRSSGSSRKKRRLDAPGDNWQRRDDDDESNAPLSETPCPPPKGFRRKLVCIFHRLNPHCFGNGEERYKTCKSRGFDYISELRTHLKRVHGLNSCGGPGCAPRNDIDQGGLTTLEKWRMEYRKHCDPSPGAAEVHCIWLDTIEITGVAMSDIPPVAGSVDTRPNTSTALILHHPVNMTSISSNQTLPPNLSQESDDVRGFQLSQTLSSQLASIQSEYDRLRAQNTLLLVNLQASMRNEQQLRLENEALRSGHLQAILHPPTQYQQLPIRESLPDAVFGVPPDSAYPALVRSFDPI